jgi:spore coat polysaccharide biosynthesis predicted glycosyltransferase SpsG
MRCLALAQAWRDAGGGPIELLTSGVPEGLVARYGREGIGVLPVSSGAAALGSILGARAPSWVVLDGYAFGEDEQRAARSAGHRLAVVDDDAAVGRYLADVVVDANVFASAERYAGRAPGAKLLLGPRYALLRRELVAAPRAPAEPTGDRPRVLLAFGGADPGALSEAAVEALAGVDAELTILVGAANPRRAAIEQVARRNPAVAVVFDAPSLRDVAEGVDLALVAAGTTCLELAHLGVPQIVVATADNQRRVAEGFAARGAARSLGDAAGLSAGALRGAVVELLADAVARRALAERGRALVDGLGASRVVAALGEGSGAAGQGGATLEVT